MNLNYRASSSAPIASPRHARVLRRGRERRGNKGREIEGLKKGRQEVPEEEGMERDRMKRGKLSE